MLDELSTSSKNKELISRFSTFVKITLDKDDERKQKSWERIKKKRENNPNYARPKSELKENIMKVLKEESRKLNETWKGEDVIADLVDRAQSLIDDGNYGDVDDCVRQAIDDGLIYSRDIWDLAEHYGVVDDSELIERYYEELFNDIYSQVEEREKKTKKRLKSLKN